MFLMLLFLTLEGGVVGSPVVLKSRCRGSSLVFPSLALSHSFQLNLLTPHGCWGPGMLKTDPAWGPPYGVRERSKSSMDELCAA